VKGLISSFKEPSESKEKRERRKEMGMGGRNPKRPVGKIKCQAILYFGAEVSADLKKFRPLTGQKFRNLWAA
jgi:hypothetical protein